MTEGSSTDDDAIMLAMWYLKPEHPVEEWKSWISWLLVLIFVPHASCARALSLSLSASLQSSVLSHVSNHSHVDIGVGLICNPGRETDEGEECILFRVLGAARP